MPVFLQTICVTFGMFSVLPVPRMEWNERNLRFAFVPLPLIGAVIGGVTFLWVWFCGLVGLPAILRGAVACLLPILLTGGFHMDGFADTSDALASHADPEKKRQILKDSHVGAFALIRVCEYFILDLALFLSFDFSLDQLLIWGGCLVLSRSLAGYAICTLPLASNSGLAHTFQSSADKKLSGVLLLLWSAVACCWVVFWGGPAALALPFAAVLLFFWFRHMADRAFGGVSGDLGGWLITAAEIIFLMILVVEQYIF